jgi:hypothetical protein
MHEGVYPVFLQFACRPSTVRLLFPPTFPMAENPIHVAKIAREIKLQLNQVRAVGALLSDGATIPFIARMK